MIKVFQRDCSKDKGECYRACVASLLELDIDVVPHFLEFGDMWYIEAAHFWDKYGYIFIGCGDLTQAKDCVENNRIIPIDGCLLATVPSRTHGSTVKHCILVDAQGNVVHDPNPNQLWVLDNIFNDSVEGTVDFIIKRRI